MNRAKAIVNVKALDKAVTLIGGKERGRVTQFVNRICVNRHMYSGWMAGRYGMSWWTALAIEMATEGKVKIEHLFKANKP